MLKVKIQKPTPLVPTQKAKVLRVADDLKPIWVAHTLMPKELELQHLDVDPTQKVKIPTHKANILMLKAVDAKPLVTGLTPKVVIVEIIQLEQPILDLTQRVVALCLAEVPRMPRVILHNLPQSPPTQKV